MLFWKLAPVKGQSGLHSDFLSGEPPQELLTGLATPSSPFSLTWGSHLGDDSTYYHKQLLCQGPTLQNTKSERDREISCHHSLMNVTQSLDEGTVGGRESWSHQVATGGQPWAQRD